jgi:hypothetical protein
MIANERGRPVRRPFRETAKSRPALLIRRFDATALVPASLQARLEVLMQSD